MTESRATATVLTTGLAFPECPRWHQGELWVSDMHTGEISRIDPKDGSLSVAFRVPGSAAGLGWDAEGRTYAVSMTDRAVYRWSVGEPERFVDMRPVSGSRTNELENDRRGGFFVSNVGFSLTKEPPRPTVLVRISPQGEVAVVAEDLICPNGMAVSRDGDELLVAESYADRITRFRIDDDGCLHDREVLVQFRDGEHPDGIDRDARGGIWAAVMGSPEVRHFGPDGTEDMRLVTSQPAWACRLGDDGRLYICTSSGMDLAELDRRPGRIEVADVNVTPAKPEEED